VKLMKDVITTLPDGPVRDVRVGVFWTAVVVEVAGQLHCGLASTLRLEDHHHGGGAAVNEAGRLMQQSARELAELTHSDSLIEASIGMAAINALLPKQMGAWIDLNAAHVIARHGADKSVAVVGHFPFIPWLRDRVGKLSVLELRPQAGDVPAEAAEDVIPQADVLAITGTTLINRTFEGLMALRRPEALVLVLGPSTPLSPVLFEYDVDIISGAVVEDIASVLRAVSQGANFRQVHRQGVRLVTMKKDG
jgi:uncharacterized protein (DUF4213/DUF364 family)